MSPMKESGQSREIIFKMDASVGRHPIISLSTLTAGGGPHGNALGSITVEIFFSGRNGVSREIGKNVTPEMMKSNIGERYSRMVTMENSTHGPTHGQPVYGITKD